MSSEADRQQCRRRSLKVVNARSLRYNKVMAYQKTPPGQTAPKPFSEIAQLVQNHTSDEAEDGQSSDTMPGSAAIVQMGADALESAKTTSRKLRTLLR